MTTAQSGAEFQMSDFESADPATQQVLQVLLPQLTRLNSVVNNALGGNLSVTANTNTAIQQVDVSTLSRWVTATLTNSWVASTGIVPRYTKDSVGRVTLAGSVKTGTLNTSCLTLPAAYRSDQEVSKAQNSAGALGILVVDAAGTVRPVSGSTAAFALDCEFLAADPTPIPYASPVQFASRIKGVSAGVLVLGGCLKGRPDLPVAVQSVTTTDNGSGQILITDMAGSGLKDATAYTLTLLILGK